MTDVALSWVVSLVIALGGVLALRVLYLEFAVKWPQNYFGGGSGLDPVVSRTPFRYGAFRLGPVFAVLVVVGAVAARVDAPRTSTVILTAAAHAISGAGVGLVRSLRSRPPRVGLAAYRTATIGGCAATAALTIALGDRADRYVPSGEDLAGSIWIALAVVLLIRVARSLTGRNRTTADLMLAAQPGLDAGLLNRLATQQTRDPAAVLAIAYAEELNRPRWVRTLERRLVRRDGSYGLMQMRARRPLSDEDSVDQFIALLDSYPPVSGESWGSLRSFFLAHNDDAAFADLAQGIYDELLAGDGRRWGLAEAPDAADLYDEDLLDDDLGHGGQPSTRPAAVVLAAAGAGFVGAALGAWLSRTQDRIA